MPQRPHSAPAPAPKLPPLAELLPATLRSARLHYSAFTPADRPAVQEGYGNPRQNRQIGFRIEAPEDLDTQMRYFNELEAEGTGRWFALRLAPDGDAIGGVGLHGYSALHAHAELGYWLLEGHQGQGYMLEAVRHLSEVLLQAGLHRLTAQIETENTASSRLIAKAGYSLEGTLVDCQCKLGRWISLECWARLGR